MSSLNPYLELMRVERPVGTLLLLWPTLAALWIASEGVPSLRTLGVFILGTLVMRSAGCVVNDIVDREVDRQVTRTRYRPLPRGAVSVRSAQILAGSLLLVAALLAAMLQPQTLLWSAGGAAIALAYPFAKRYTYMPQAVLGLAFSWGIVLAFVEVQGGVPDVGWILFVGSALWIVAYDTLYAMADRPDDQRIGVRSTAVLFGDGALTIVLVLQFCTLFVWYLVGRNLEFGAAFNLGLLAIAGLFAWHHKMVRLAPSLAGDEDRRQREAYTAAFAHNVWVGLALFLAVVAEIDLAPWLQGR